MSTRSTKAPFQHMKQFKAIAMDYAYYASLSDDSQLYCLTDKQIYILLAQMDYVGWLTRWYNTEDITQTTVDRVKSDLMEALMSCVDVSVLVDQANENLVTMVQNRLIQSASQRAAYTAMYTGTPTSINPNAPTTTFASSLTRDSALCAALMGFVYQFCRAKADQIRAGQIGGLAAISLVAVLLIPGLNIFFLAGAAIAVGLGLTLVGVTTETAILALTDTDALDNVVCAMKSRLDGLSVSSANFQTAFTGAGFAVGSHEQIIADFITPTLADNYLMFLDMLGNGYVGVTTNQPLPTCPCSPPPGINCANPWTYILGTFSAQTVNTLDVVMVPNSGGYKIHVTTATPACIFYGWQVVSGTFTVFPQFAPFTQGVRFITSTGVDSGDPNLSGFIPRQLLFFSTTPCTLRLTVHV